MELSKTLLKPLGAEDNKFLRSAALTRERALGASQQIYGARNRKLSQDRNLTKESRS